MVRVFYFFSVQEAYFRNVSRELSSRFGMSDFSGMVYGADQKDMLLAMDFPWRNIWAFNEYYTRKWAALGGDAEYLNACERKYGPPNANHIIAADRFLKDFDRETGRKLMEAAFRCVEEALDTDRPDVIISEGVSCMLSYAVYLVARHRNIPFLCIVHSRIGGRIAVVRNPMDRMERVEAEFAKLKERDLTPPEYEEAEAFVRQFQQSKAKPDYMHSASKVPLANANDMQTIVSTIRRYYRRPHNYLLTHPAKMVLNRLWRNVRARLSQPLFEMPVSGEKYVVFPLHFQPEASTLIRGTFYRDQLALIDNIAMSLPASHRLYVKEHLVSVGKRPLSYYRRLKSIPNVRLISARADSHEVIRNASAITTITGTMGWEAVLYERPVITFGEASYNAFDLVYRAGEISTLPDVIRRAITEYRPDHILLLKFVLAILRGTYPGFRPSDEPYALADQNVRHIADALACEIGLLREPAIAV